MAMFVMRGKQPLFSFSSFVSCLAVVAGLALGSATPAGADTLLTGWGATSFGVFSDGTSNTLLFTETTRLSVCFDSVGVNGTATGLNPIQNGSNTSIDLGGVPFLAQVGFVTDRRPLASIVDGSSNTIFVGEVSAGSFCLGQLTPIGTFPDGISNTIDVGEGAIFDVCIDNARLQQVTDGTSNTIVVGEFRPRTCFNDVEVPETSALLAPEPASATLLLMGLASTALARGRRRRRR